MIRTGDLIEVIQEDREHPFQLGDQLVVTELCDEGCVWAKREADKLLGCLIPSEFKKIEKKKTKKKGAKK